MAIELHIGCGGEVKLVGDYWKCDKCKRRPVPVEETLLCLVPSKEQ